MFGPTEAAEGYYALICHAGAVAFVCYATFRFLSDACLCAEKITFAPDQFVLWTGLERTSLFESIAKTGWRYEKTALGYEFRRK